MATRILLPNAWLLWELVEEKMSIKWDLCWMPGCGRWAWAQCSGMLFEGGGTQKLMVSGRGSAQAVRTAQRVQRP